MPVRIMHIADSLGRGGLENGLVNLINNLDPGRFEHVICAMRGLGANMERLPKDRVPVVCLGKKASGIPVQAWAIAREIRRFRPDIVHSRNWGTLDAVFAARLAGGCAIIHGEHGIDVNTRENEPWRRRVLRRAAYETASRVVSVSYQLREFHAGRTGFPSQKIAVIHNGVDSSRFFPDDGKRAFVRKTLGISADEFCIGCVGNLLPVKDHMTVIRALRGMADCGKWKLLLAGDGPELPRLQAAVGAHEELMGRVLFLGSRSDIPDLLNAMDVYVLSSLTEGICNSLLEAMATALPVVVTATGGNPEVVVDGASGLMFPVGDCRKLAEHLQLLSESADARRQFGRQARERVLQEFSIRSMAHNYAALYESLVQTKERPVVMAAGT